jgi:hypothetical protein
MWVSSFYLQQICCTHQAYTLYIYIDFYVQILSTGTTLYLNYRLNIFVDANFLNFTVGGIYNYRTYLSMLLFQNISSRENKVNVCEWAAFIYNRSAVHIKHIHYIYI